MMDTSHTTWKVDAWAFRWHECCEPGCWVVSFSAGLWDLSMRNYDAVMDDFGNLVEVQR